MVPHTGENLVDEEGVTISLVSSFQATCVDGSEFDAPEAYRFSTDSDAAFSEKIFDIAMAEIEAVVKADCVGNDIWREPVAFVGIQGPSLPISTT
jgi:hypothetical protein